MPTVYYQFLKCPECGKKEVCREGYYDIDHPNYACSVCSALCRPVVEKKERATFVGNALSREEYGRKQKGEGGVD